MYMFAHFASGLALGAVAVGSLLDARVCSKLLQDDAVSLGFRGFRIQGVL